MKLKSTAKLTAQDEQVCLNDSKYILFEIRKSDIKGPYKLLLAEQARFGNLAALPCLIFQDFQQNIFGIIEAYLFTMHHQFCCTFQLYQIPDQRTVPDYTLAYVTVESPQTLSVSVICLYRVAASIHSENLSQVFLLQ